MNRMRSAMPHARSPEVERGALGFIATVGKSAMLHTPRFRAEVTGHFVQFFSRDTKTKTVRWRSRFKCEDHTLRDAKEAKREYEASGKTSGLKTCARKNHKRGSQRAGGR
jgi:hypothetical protein